MAKKIKRRKGLDTFMGQQSSSSAWGRAAFMAEPNNHELDPDGDLVLILHPSSSGYKNVVHDAPSEDPQPRNISEEPNAVEEPAAWSVVEGAAAGTAAERFFANSDDPILGGHKTALIPDEKDLCHAVRIRVSSKHLTLASPVFRTMFKVKYKEGLNLHSQGHAELPLPDDNPAAFLIILHLIHGQIRKVPRKIDLWMLTELAILVDKYELLETVEMWLDYWLQDLESTIPLTLNNDLLPWICISWVFKKSAILKKVTKIAQTESQGLLQANQLPIPECVLNTIDQHRQNTLTEIFTYLQDDSIRIFSPQRRPAGQIF